MYLNSQGRTLRWNLSLSSAPQPGPYRGKKIDLFQQDYGYKADKAKQIYEKFKKKGCIAILGWGSADTEALTKTVAKDKMPYVSASYSAKLNDPKEENPRDGT